MDTHLESAEHELSPAKSRSLVIVAVLIALLGLTTLDVAPSASARKQHADDARSVDCIVASAIFAGAPPTAEVH